MMLFKKKKVKKISLINRKMIIPVHKRGKVKQKDHKKNKWCHKNSLDECSFTKCVKSLSRDEFGDNDRLHLR